MKKLLVFAFVFSVVFSSPTMTFANLLDGRVAYYSFDGNADDTSGYNNNGIVYGASLTADRFGQDNHAYLFDAENDYISVADSDSLKPFSKITLTAWINISGFGKDPVWFNRPIVAKGFFDYGLMLSHSSNLIDARLSNDSMSGMSLDCFNNLNLNTWYFLSFVYDGSEVISYLNGIKMGHGNFSGNIRESGMPLLIGKDAGSKFYFDGIIDDVSIYNRPLSTTDIQELYNTTPIPEPSSILLLGIALLEIIALRKTTL